MTDLRQKMVEAMTTHFNIDDPAALELARTRTDRVLQAIENRETSHGTVVVTWNGNVEYADGTTGTEKLAYVAIMDIVHAAAFFCRADSGNLVASRLTLTYVTESGELDEEIGLHDVWCDIEELTAAAALTETRLGHSGNS